MNAGISECLFEDIRNACAYKLKKVKKEAEQADLNVDQKLRGHNLNGLALAFALDNCDCHSESSEST